MTCCGHAETLGPLARALVARLFSHANISSLPLRPHLMEEWFARPYPHFAQDEVFGFHAPVGNLAMFDAGHKVDVVVAGFCVSGETGAKYINETIDFKDGEEIAVAAANLSFDTDAMRKGLVSIIEDLGIHSYLGLDSPEAVLNTRARHNPPIAFTQALCPITVRGSWKVHEVMEEMLRNGALREFASHSLTQWYVWLRQHAGSSTRLVLMGKNSLVRYDGTVAQNDRRRLHLHSTRSAELVRLLTMSTLEEGRVTIAQGDQGDKSLYDWARQAFRNRLFVVPHAARYPLFRGPYLEECRRRVIC